MSRCDAVVVEISGADVWLEVAARAPSCRNCTDTSACQEGLMGMSAAPRRYRLENKIGARVGDHVSLAVADGELLRVALASYVLPVLLAIGAAVMGQSVAGDAGSMAGAVAGVACGIVLLRSKEIRVRRVGGLFSLQVQTRELRFKDKS